MTKALELDLHELPLKGRILIEASAGTGKTYSLAALYVRLVTGLGETAFKEGLHPKQILVLTFTRAATQELRSRIRERLQTTADILEGNIAAELADDFVQHFLATAEDDVKEKYAKRCRQAANDMDVAAIYTIHGFCQRSLKQFAFASGQSFELDLETDTQQLYQDAVNDYWRLFMQNLPQVLVDALLTNNISQPKDIIALAKKEEIEASEEPVQAPLPESLFQFKEKWAELCAIKSEADEAFIEQKVYLQDWFAAKKADLNGSKINKTFLTNLEEAQNLDEIRSNYIKLLTLNGLAECWKKSATPEYPSLSCLELIEQYAILNDELKFPEADIAQHAMDWIEAEQEKQLSQRALVTFNSMVKSLAKATSNSKDLTSQLRAAYPCTLIDEFQDTDKEQYSIFSDIYRDADLDSYVWMMIGDPKQAIYSFRGADIATYIEAKSNTKTLRTLTTNYRSSTEIINATNALFALSPLNSESEEGVFNHAEIPFEEITAPDKDEYTQLYINDEVVEKALSVFYLDNAEDATHSKGNASALLSRLFAQKTAELLQGSAQGNNYLQSNVSRETFKTIQPSDITLLVRGKTEAGLLKRDLKKLGIDSVYLSEQNSVYQESEAVDLDSILQAIINPQDNTLLKAALATPLLNYSWQEQYEIQQDEKTWQNILVTFRSLKQVWQRYGALPMLYRLVDELKLANRLSSERSFTNLFHLAELLQEQRKQLVSIEAQLEYFQTAIYEAALGNEDNSELLIRLENERNLVQIMTLHKSKGLEFPVVMIPFASLAVDKKTFEEGIDEEIRLLYVGITRAKYACYLGLLKNATYTTKEHHLFTTPLGRLLFGKNNNAAVSEEYISEQLVQLEKTGLIEVNSPCEIDSVISYQYEDGNDLAAIIAEQDLKQVTQQKNYWGVSSYSSIANRKVAHEIGDVRLIDDEGVSIQELIEREVTDSVIHQFKKGRETGNLLHDILEQSCKQGFDQADYAALVEKACQVGFWQNDKDALLYWLDKLHNTPLNIDKHTLCLRDLNKQETLAETEFWLQTPELKLNQLNQLAAEFTGLQAPTAFAGYDEINGMLKGFIDLIFCIDDKYYVLDYKTNHLGSNDTAYSQVAMQKAMLEHRYDLQGLIYQQALHYLLASRLGEQYQPEQHLGGCYFFFLRGIESESQGLLHLPANVAVIEKMERLFPVNKG